SQDAAVNNRKNNRMVTLRQAGYQRLKYVQIQRGMSRIAVMILHACAFLTPALCAEPVPKFEDYPVREIFTGKAAAPKLVRPEERQFRTAISRGVAKGEGVFETGAGKQRTG